MSAGNGGQDGSKRAVPDGFDSWNAYWTAQGMPWRTEPEIDEERQRYLAERRAVKSDIEKGIYPYRDEDGSIKLTRADVEWLLATHESGGIRGPVDWSDERQHSRRGLDIRGADLRTANLHDLPLAGIVAGLYAVEQLTLTAEQLAIARASAGQREMAAVHLEQANLHRVHLEGAILAYAHLADAVLVEAHLESAILTSAHLERALLWEAHVQGALLLAAHLEGADLARAYFDDTTVLTDAVLSGASLADVHWRGVNLTGVDWGSIKQVSVGRAAATRRSPHRGRRERKSAKLGYNRTLGRTYRQLAAVLSEQGMDREAARYNYLALRHQRKMLWYEGRLDDYLASLVLDAVAGYGYRPWRLVACYTLILLLYSVSYYMLSRVPGSPVPQLTASEALVFSLQVFTMRAVPGNSTLHDAITTFASTEVIVSLAFGFIFANVVTQRYFRS